MYIQWVVVARMHRTQVYLEQALVEGLQRLARREGSSMGELIRRGAWQVLNSAPAIEPWSAEDPIWSLIGMITEGEPSDDARHVDEILYGAPQEHRAPRLRIAEQKPNTE